MKLLFMKEIVPMKTVDSKQSTISLMMVGGFLLFFNKLSRFDALYTIIQHMYSLEYQNVIMIHLSVAC